MSPRPVTGLLAAEVNSWTWAWGGWSLEVWVLHHSGVQLQTLTTVVEPQPGPGPCSDPGPGQLPSSPGPAVIRGTSWFLHQAGKCNRKEDRGLREKGGGPTELEKLDLIWQ